MNGGERGKAAEASIERHQGARAPLHRPAILREDPGALLHGALVTLCNYDKGLPITADDPTTQPLFRVAQITGVVRVFVNVPQVFASGIQNGQYADVYCREDLEPQARRPGDAHRWQLAWTPNTRTLLTEVDVPNPNGELLPGMYLQVDFNFPRLAPSVMIPSAAITFRADGAWVGVLDGGNTVHYQKVQTGRDFGVEMEILDGLSEGATVIVRPGDELADGTVVQPASSPAIQVGGRHAFHEDSDLPSPAAGRGVGPLAVGGPDPSPTTRRRAAEDQSFREAATGRARAAAS